MSDVDLLFKAWGKVGELSWPTSSLSGSRYTSTPQLNVFGEAGQQYVMIACFHLLRIILEII